MGDIGSIFVNYRRQQSEWPTLRLHDRLVVAFGKDHIFTDVDSIEPGLDFTKVLETAVGSCRVLLAVIGRDWLNARDEEGRLRLENPADWVRVEIESALRRPKVHVIPVLIDGATMPRADQLPGELAQLSLRQAVKITADGFTAEVDTLIATLHKILQLPEPKPSPQPAPSTGPIPSTGNIPGPVPPRTAAPMVPIALTNYPVLPEDLQWSGPAMGNLVVEHFVIGPGAWVKIADPLVVLRADSGPVTLWSTYIGRIEMLTYQRGQPLVPGLPLLTLAVSGWLFRVNYKMPFDTGVLLTSGGPPKKLDATGTASRLMVNVDHGADIPVPWRSTCLLYVPAGSHMLSANYELPGSMFRPATEVIRVRSGKRVAMSYEAPHGAGRSGKLRSALTGLSEGAHVTAQREVSRGALAEPSAQQASRQGRIPLHLRVGITGHRFIAQPDDALMTLGEALDHIEGQCRKGTAATPVSLTVVSALAEGADRIAARAAVRRGAILEVVLPLPLDDYLTDFESEESRSEFCTLLADHASAITELPAAAVREAAYERAGQVIVDRSDVVLALWDGRAARGRGGTAEIVSYARRQGVPILQVTVKRLDPGSPRPRTVHEPELPARFCLLSGSAFKWLDRYNSGSPRTGRKSSQPSLLPSELDMPVPPTVQGIVNYAQPYFNRAERVARRSQRTFIWLTRLLYSLAAGAVILVATQVIFFGHDPEIVWGEVVALATVVVALIVGRRAGFHDRWLAARSLAERIRSGVFLAAVGAGNELRTAQGVTPPTECDQPDPGRKRLARAGAWLNQWARGCWAAARDGARRIRARLSSGRGGPRPAGSELAYPAEPDPNQEWVERAFREIYWRARRSPAAESDLATLKELVTRAWINDQIAYHTKVFRRLTRRQRQLSWLAVILFGVSALVALFHSTRLLESPSEPDIWGYCSVVIPAVGAAIAGYSAQREYARIAERSRQMVMRLQAVREQVERSNRLSSLQRAVRRTEVLMRTDTAEWYEVVRLHDLEVPAG